MSSNFTDQVGRSVGRHFVSLSCVQGFSTGPEKLLLFSGFVAEITGEWFYVTAGHILRDVQLAINAGSAFSIWRLGDQTAAHGKFEHTAIPFDFEIEKWIVIEEGESGMDYAAVHLASLYRLQLEAGGVEALAKDAWSNHISAFDHWALAGIPSESVLYDGKTNIGAHFVLAPLIEADIPAQAGKRAENQFYAQLGEGSEGLVKDLDGMSGGPVIGLKHSDGIGWRYAVIGVQSAWYPSIRTVAICPFSSFALALEQAVEPVLARLHAELNKLP